MSTNQMAASAVIFIVIGLFVASIRCATSGSPYYGKKAGELSEIAHNVSGTVYVIDEHHLRIRDLVYDGTAPAAFFWIGLKGKANDIPDVTGLAIPDEKGRSIRLQNYTDADVVLTLKKGIKVSDLKWLSIWCKIFELDFGHILFPSNLEVPKATVIGQFANTHDSTFHSGPIRVLDHKTVRLEKFQVTGKLEGAHFVGGKNSNGAATSDLQTHKLPTAEHGYNALPSGPTPERDLTLNFPSGLSIFDVDYIAVSSASGGILGRATVPAGLNVPPHVANKKSTGAPQKSTPAFQPVIV